MHKRLPRRKLAKDRAALSSRITYKPYTCIQRALISLATGASSSHRFVIKCAFHLVPAFLRHAKQHARSHCSIAMLTGADYPRRAARSTWVSLAVLAKYDTKHNPIIIAMFLRLTFVFLYVFSIAKKRKG